MYNSYYCWLVRYYVFLHNSGRALVIFGAVQSDLSVLFCMPLLLRYIRSTTTSTVIAQIVAGSTGVLTERASVGLRTNRKSKRALSLIGWITGSSPGPALLYHR
ncbi:hypothetical protein BDV26DRAFT_253981 [Aspergillus bertholletiae]|uniref:Uncharacterized protein n=1 Tax=Aspergillus bertholletiae TaxID=1226010 RepID=A0A5N7BK44_9EURO|nr:hypothetical protein BDV26DRAFT_253981 [Aspergillus bertholletiae]